MSHFLPLTLATLLFGSVAAAQSTAPMTGEEFRDRMEGYTIFFRLEGTADIGIEAYHPNGRVTWVTNGDECRKGRWYPQDDRICFVYEDDPTHYCARIYDRNGTIVHEHSGGGVWVSTSISTDPIPCTFDFLGA